MPLQWKIYFWCSLYALIWSATFFFIVLKEYVASRNSYTDTEFLSGISLWLLFGMVIKSSLSIKSLLHFKNGTMPLKFERKLIATSFSTTILFVIFLLWYLMLFLLEFIKYPPNFFNKEYGVAFLQITALISIVAVIVSAIFINIYDIVMLKAIRKKYYDNLTVSEEAIKESKGEQALSPENNAAHERF
jgi:hypothetical protein